MKTNLTPEAVMIELNRIKTDTRPTIDFDRRNAALDYAKQAVRAMRGNKYQEQAMRLNDGKNTERLISKILKYHRFNADLPGLDKVGLLDFGGVMHAALGMSGEVGEVNDIIKKWVFHESDLDLEHLKKEIGDVMWYISLLCECCGFNLEDVMKTNIEKLWKRYPNGFSTHDANHRSSDDI